MNKTDIFIPGNHIPELESAGMTFTSNITLGATISVSNFTSTHTNIYSKYANWYKTFIEFNFKEQPSPFWTSTLDYSKNRPLPNANCPLMPQPKIKTPAHIPFEIYCTKGCVSTLKRGVAPQSLVGRNTKKKIWVSYFSISNSYMKFEPPTTNSSCAVT